MKRLICKIFGCKPVVYIANNKVYCGRCKIEGFMETIKKENGEIIEFLFKDFKFNK